MQRCPCGPKRHHLCRIWGNGRSAFRIAGDIEEFFFGAFFVYKGIESLVVKISTQRMTQIITVNVDFNLIAIITTRVAFRYPYLSRNENNSVLTKRRYSEDERMFTFAAFFLTGAFSGA